MPEPVDLKGAFNLPPEEAVRFFEAKGYRFSKSSWSEMMHDDHRDFTVARVASIDLLVSFKTSLAKALADGTTLEQWKKDVADDVAKHGFNPRRLALIYDTNLRMARATGQWVRIQEAKAERPYLRYSAVMDRRTRPQHRAWHGTVLPVDDKWWISHFPPNGWNCRCNVQQLSERDMHRYGYKVSARPNNGARAFTDAAGRVHSVPAGIDPGFGYNPGIAETDRLATKAATSFTEANRVGLGSAAQKAFSEIVTSALGDIAPAKVAAFAEALAANDAAAIESMVDETLKSGIARKGIAAGEFGDKFRTAVADDNVRRYAVTEFARAARADPDYVAKLPIGTVSKAEAAAVQPATGVDIAGYSRVINANDIRHTRNSHGDPVKEANDGQIILDDTDYSLIEEIVRVAYQVTAHSKSKGGQGLRIEYRAQIEGRYYLYVETVSRKERRVGLKTLFKSWQPL